MSKWVEYLTIGFFGTVGLAIIFVKAGQGKNGQSGGQQSAAIITAGGTALSQVASALEG